MFTGRIVDVHSHLYTRKFLKELEKRTEFPVLTTNKTGVMSVIFSETQANDVPESFVNLGHRIKQMDKFGITVQLLSGTSPWTDTFPSAELATFFSRLSNDELGRIVSESKGRFLGLATLPLLAPNDAAEELDRVVSELGLSGAILATNVKGTYLSEKSFEPIFEVASKRNCLLFIHPSSPPGADRLKENGLLRSVGYPLETTVCLVKMAYSGLFDTFPNLRILSAHLAGALPYLNGRIDTAWKNFADSKGKLEEPPVTKLRRVLFADTISYSTLSLKLARDFLGISKLFFGTDYPFEWGIGEAQESVEASFEKDFEIRAIYAENFEKILKEIRD